MRKLPVVVAMFLTLTFASSVLAAGYGAAGCGPGSMFMKKNTKSEQLMSWLTNVVISNLIGPVQMYAITTGVSNCGGSSASVLAQNETTAFVDKNFDGLAKQMATGNGEDLETLAGLLGCPADSFGAFTQRNYEAIFVSDQITPETMLTELRKNIGMDHVFASACQKI